MINLKAVIIHNGADSSVAYANQLNEQLAVEATVVDVHDPRPIRLALPIRAVPSVGVLIIPSSLEEAGDLETLLRQLNLMAHIDEVDQVMTALAETPTAVPKALRGTVQSITSAEVATGG